MLEPSTVRTVTTTPGYGAVAVIFNGNNLEEVRRLVSYNFGPDISYENTSYVQEMQPPLIKLWDGRTATWRWAQPGDCIVADEQGVLILEPQWFYVLFQADPLAPTDQLQLAGHLLGQLQQVLGQVSAAITSPAAADTGPIDPLDPGSLQPVTFPVHADARPLLLDGDLWADARSCTWEVVRTDEEKRTIVKGVSGDASYWDWVCETRGPMRLLRRGGHPIAA